MDFAMTPMKLKPGRPPKKLSEQRRHILSVRFREKTWARLVRAAESNRRSLSQEVEFRVEQALLQHGYASREESMAAYRAEQQHLRKLKELAEKRDPSVQWLIDMLERKK
jgi:TraY domain